jgi:urate oxidase / 2-oxo-4-hydroxy-4-carboxy-5-ureidoimidazoline decarboxylase
VERFASGWKQHYYGKGDVVVYRLNRDGKQPADQSAVFGANVLMLVYGDAFWPTYTTGDNTGLIATDSMKNFIQRQTVDYTGSDLQGYCRFLAGRFLDIYSQVQGVQVTAAEIPYGEIGSSGAFAPSGPERAVARIEVDRTGVREVMSGLRGFKLLRLGGSAFEGFVRDEYTTLPEMANRPLHMWLDVDWHYSSPAGSASDAPFVEHVRGIVRDVFQSFHSRSIQQVIYQIGTRMLTEMTALAEVHLEANNRTWDTVAERGEALGVYTDPRPPYGCLGLSLKR